MYRWFLAFHLIFVISWMAGILYLYRVLVNLAEQRNASKDVQQVLNGMAYRLYRVIVVPAMSLATGFGVGMLWLNPSLLETPWMHVKLLSIVFLFIFTIKAGYLQRRYSSTGALPTSRRLRILNEVPTVLMIIIIIMVIVRPF